MTTIDHIVWAESTLASRPAAIETLLSATLDDGGSHPDLGTRNIVGSLGHGTYLEALAPNEDTANRSNLGGRLSRLRQPCVYHWAISAGDLNAVANAARTAGLRVGEIKPGTRKLADDTILHWRLLFLREPELGLAAPFFIDWQASPHPSTQASRLGELAGFQIVAPAVARLNRLFDAIRAPVQASEGDRISVQASIRTASEKTVLLRSVPDQLSGL